MNPYPNFELNLIDLQTGRILDIKYLLKTKFDLNMNVIGYLHLSES